MNSALTKKPLNPRNRSMLMRLFMPHLPKACWQLVEQLPTIVTLARARPSWQQAIAGFVQHAFVVRQRYVVATHTVGLEPK
jgi:hypothetical protein